MAYGIMAYGIIMVYGIMAYGSTPYAYRDDAGKRKGNVEITHKCCLLQGACVETTFVPHLMCCCYTPIVEQHTVTDTYKW